MSKKYLLLFSIFILFLGLFFPKKLKATANHIVISQIQISGLTATDEFIELFNPTNEIIDLTGYRLTKKVSSGTQSNLIASMSGTINPNSYILLGHNDYLGTTPKDKTYSTSSITSNNTVILYSDAGVNILDKVGFGASFESETLPFLMNPLANQSIRRINNGDTDNNSVDFELLETSSPRNSNFVSETATPLASPEPTATAGTPSTSPTPTVSPSPTPTPSPSIIPSPNITSSPTPKPTKKHDDDDEHEYRLPFGIKCKMERHEYEFKKHKIKYFKLSFHRHK